MKEREREGRGRGRRGRRREGWGGGRRRREKGGGEEGRRREERGATKSLGRLICGTGIFHRSSDPELISRAEMFGFCMVSSDDKESNKTGPDPDNLRQPFCWG